MTLSNDSIFMAIVTLGSVALNWRFASTISGLKLEFREQLDKLRVEFGKEYLPVQLDTMRHQTIAERIASIESEVAKSRESVHELRSQFTALVMGKLDRIEQKINELEHK
jgi:predicted  nucleic acid-binding Zn-ribbon protein